MLSFWLPWCRMLLWEPVTLRHNACVFSWISLSAKKTCVTFKHIFHSWHTFHITTCTFYNLFIFFMQCSSLGDHFFSNYAFFLDIFLILFSLSVTIYSYGHWTALPPADRLQTRFWRKIPQVLLCIEKY